MTADLPDRATDREREIDVVLCPKCAGTGLMSRPPGIAGDRQTWVSHTIGPYVCDVCDGRKLIDPATALAARPAPDDGEAGMSADTLIGPRTVPGVHGYPDGTDTRPTVTSEPSVGIRAQTVTPTEEA